MLWKLVKFSLFHCFKVAFVRLILSMFHLRKGTFVSSRENRWLCLFTHKQAFAAGVGRTCTNPTCGVQRPVADDFVLQLHWCDAERTTGKKKKTRLAGQKENSRTFLPKHMCFFGRAFKVAVLLCLFEGERRVVFYVPSSVRQRCRL